jgi:hypothetical protein
VNGVDLSKLPSGQLSWAELVRYAVASDDRVERYFLEVKSNVDLNSNTGRAKVAKFILGAANRDPTRAAARFGGHAVMLLGIGAGEAMGINPFEAMDLARYVSRIIGANGPAWDFERIPAADGRDVIAVHVDPPTGDVWTCRADADGLRNGGIYVRADGETREATGDELRVMLDRMKSKSPDVDLEVSVNGVIHGLVIDTNFLAEVVEAEALRLRRLATPPTHPYSVRLPALDSLNRDSRSKDAYLQEVEAWRDDAIEDPLAGVRDLASHLRQGIQVRVINRTSRYLRGVRIEISFDQPLEALTWDDPEDRKHIAKFPRAPKEWGSDPYLGVLLPRMTPQPLTYPRSHHGVVRIVTESPPSLVLEMDDLRPHEVYVSDDDDVVLAIFAAEIEPSPVRGRWAMTAEDVHELFSGDLEVPVEVSDWRQSVVDWYRPEATPRSGD